MATTNITELSRRARAATEAITRTAPRGLTASGRTSADLAAEMTTAISRIHDALAETEAFIDIAAGEPLTTELEELAALGAAALFLGRRLFESNAAQILELHPELEADLQPVAEVALLLGALSNRLLEVVREAQPPQRKAA